MWERSNKSEMKEEGVEKCLDSELWHACAGGMVQIPRVNSKVFYFPQGHAEHALTAVDFGVLPRFPPMILCRVVSVKFLADSETDEVYAKIRLVPVGKDEPCFDADDGIWDRNSRSESSEKPASFAKTLTQSDANNGGGFSVPRYCAETIFPPLDFKTDPPVQNVIAKDVHGVTWKFRHIYRGTPRRHLLTTGWSTFVNQKKLVAGDSIVFLKAENGDLCVGIRRAKKNSLGGGNNEISNVWNSNAGNNSFAGFPSCLKEDSHKLRKNVKEKARVKPESVVEATFLASNGQPFEVVYYPCANTPEFCVKASLVSAVMRIQWSPGMRFKMPFETEDSSRISWFLGTVSCVQVFDPLRWPNSPWRMLQVNWDEPDLLQNVKCVSPWLVEMVPDMPLLNVSTSSPSRKKLRFTTPHHQPDFPLVGRSQFPILSFSDNPLLGYNNGLSGDNLRNISAGIQGTRHVAQVGFPLPDFHLSVNNKLHMGIFPPPNNNDNNLMQQHISHHHRCNFARNSTFKNVDDERASCFLSMGSMSKIKEKSNDSEPPHFVLFGKIILTEEQMTNNAAANVQISKSDGYYNMSGLEMGHCKVFLESEDAGRTLDLSVLGSYEELYKRLEDMFGIEESEMHRRVLYRGVNGEVKQAGEEPFGEFVKAAKILTVFTKPISSNGSERKLITGFQSGERGLDSSSRAGPLSVFV